MALTRTGGRRLGAGLVALIAIVGLAVSLVNAEGWLGVSVVVRMLALIAAVALAKYALGSSLRALKAADVEGTPVPAAKHGVLFMNLKSGGGKAERFPSGR